MPAYDRQGYLNSHFQLFHILDTDQKMFDFHYHDFHKILIFLQGDVSYIVEGKSYNLTSHDIVLINRNDIHKPVIHSKSPYERIIAYVEPAFLENLSLSCCFQKAKEVHSNVVRIPAPEKSSLFKSIKRLEQSFSDSGYASDFYQELLFLEFLVHLNRASLSDYLTFIDTVHYHPKVLGIMQYISEHLTEELHIDEIASRFFMSRYHMMRTFKAETGYTIGNYITEKRLLYAKELLIREIPITQICFDCGFQNYSTFSRAYKKVFHESPRETLSHLQNT